MRGRQVFKQCLFALCGVFLLCTEAHAQLDRNYFFMRGSDYIVSGRYREAIDALNILLRSDSRSSEGYFLRGVAKFNLGDLQGAYADLSHALDENPVYTYAYHYRGLTLSAMGDYDNAIPDFNRALEMRPNQAAGYFSRGLAYFMNQQFKEAIKDYNQFIKIEPLEADGYINRGTSYLFLKDTTAAMQDYNLAVRVRPYYKNGYLRRGMLYLSEGNNELCVKDMSSAIGIDSTFAVAYFYRAIASYSEGRLMSSLSDLDHAIRYDSLNWDTYFRRALLRAEIGDYNRALDDYNRLAEANPDNLMVYYNRAGIHAELGNLNLALADYDRAIELYPDFANAYKGRASVWLQLRNRRNYERDIRIASMIINKYKNTITSENLAQFADNSIQFDRLLGLDNRNRTSGSFSTGTSSDLQLMPMFRFAIDTTQSSTSVNKDLVSAKYRGSFASGVASQRELTFAHQMEFVGQFLDSLAIPQLSLTTRTTTHTNTLSDSLETSLIGTIKNKMEDNMESQPTLSELFYQALVLTAEKQYNAALDIWNLLASMDGEFKPLLLINSAVTKSEMTTFVTSFGSAGQNTVLMGQIPSFSSSTSAGSGVSNIHYDFTASIAELRAAAAILPEFPYIYYNLGNLYFLNGYLPQAIECYDRALELHPEFGECYNNRALAHERLDEYQKSDLDIAAARRLLN